MKMGIHHFLYIDIGIYLAIIETFILAALSLSCRIPSLVKDKQGPRASLPPVLHKYLPPEYLLRPREYLLRPREYLLRPREYLLRPREYLLNTKSLSRSHRQNVIYEKVSYLNVPYQNAVCDI
jgi:hypothetical protein